MCALYVPGVGSTSRRKARRRGSELEAAVLDAVLRELDRVGYDELTFDGVAQAAGTSRTVLHRRWAAKAELVRTALERQTEHSSISLVDTGALRGDMVALLSDVNARYRDTASSVVVHLLSHWRATGTSPAVFRADLKGRGATPLEVIEQRALDRGEFIPSQLTQRMLSLPLDLLKQELLTTLQPASDAVILEIVDDVFMPVVRSRPRC